MRATISMRDPYLLREAEVGDLFVPHAPGLQECVCARAHEDVALYPYDHPVDVVVIACQANTNEFGYRPSGAIVALPPDSWISFVDAVEPTAFRARKPPAECCSPDRL